ncbi:apolipoprotein B receptor [Paroedura picta]|uniref:apolipoprotein B receptor n=1 Tax=Paroedura picta TaxID=143630 RepID=UPI004056F3B3
MDLFRRLLGTLHQTVDYIATFTTYLLGNAAHPGAEESGNTAPRRSPQDCDAKTAWDISPRDNLKAFERPPVAETISAKQDIQEAPGKDFGSAQATEAILRASKSRDDGQEDDGQKRSEPPNVLPDAPKSGSPTASSIQQRDLEGPTVTGGPHQWEPEGWARMGAVQKASKPEKPLAGGQEHEEIERAGEAEGTWQKGQKETEGDEEEAPGEAETVGGKQSGSDEAEQTGGFQQQGARMVEDLRLNPDGEFVGRANREDNQKVELDIKVGDEEVQPAVPLNAEIGGDQQREPGEAETKSQPQWKPEEKGTFEAQKEDPQGPTEEEDGQQKGLGGFETEGPQLGEIEGFVKNEGTEWKEKKENEGDNGEELVEEGQRRDGASWTGEFRLEMAKIVEDLRSEPEGQLPGDTNMEANQMEESGIDTGNEGVLPAMAESAETGEDQQGEPEGEAGARCHPQWKMEEKVISEVQEENPAGITEKGQQRGLGEAEMEAHQQWELEGFVRNEETQQREQRENWRGERDAKGGEDSEMEEQRGEGTAWTGRSQEEVDRMAEGQWLVVERQLSGGVDAENYKQGKPDMETEDESPQQSLLDGVESRGNQQGGPEQDAEGRSSLQWEPEEIVTLEVQEEDPKEITEKGGSQQRGLEEAEMEAHQQWELEGFVRNEETQQKEQVENGGDEPEATGGEESVMEEERGEGTAWTGRSQQEVGRMPEGQWLEVERQFSGGVVAENYKQGEPGMKTEDKSHQQSMLDGVESREDQEGGPEQETEGRNNFQWEPEEIVALEIQEEEEITEKEGSQQIGLEEAEVEEIQQRELEGLLRNERTPWREKEKEREEQEATYGEQQSGDGTAWTGRSQEEVAKMANSQWLEAEWQLAGGSKAENNKQGEADMETGDVGAQQTIPDGAEVEGDQQGGQEGEAEARKNLQWEPEKTMTLEEHREEGNGQQQVLGRAEEREGHQHEKPEGLLRNEVENEEQEQEEHLGKPSLERDQQKDPEAFTGITVLEEAVAATMMEEPEVQGQEPRETEGAKRSLPHEHLGEMAPVDTCLLAGSGTFPDAVPSLDTSAQKERVLLRRKSSIRRAPSLKRPKPPTETPPPQETGIEELSPSQPPSSGRPKLKHAGFGPMHPNMMAELQMRLRKPQ